MNTYAVVYRDSKAQRHVELVEAPTAEAAKAAIKVVEVSGLGGKYVSCVEITKVERLR